MTGDRKKEQATAMALRKRAGSMAESIFRSLNIDENAEQILAMLRQERQDDGKAEQCTPKS